MAGSRRNPMVDAALADDLIRFRALIANCSEADTPSIVDVLSAVACPHRRAGFVAAFLDAGFDPDVPRRDGTTILMWAAHWGSVNIIALLVAAHVEVDARDPDGRTALMYAIEGGHLRAVQQLATAGADITAADHRGKTVEAYATVVGRNIRLPLGAQIAVHWNDRTNSIVMWLEEFRRTGRHTPLG